MQNNWNTNFVLKLRYVFVHPLRCWNDGETKETRLGAIRCLHSDRFFHGLGFQCPHLGSRGSPKHGLFKFMCSIHIVRYHWVFMVRLIIIRPKHGMASTLQPLGFFKESLALSFRIRHRSQPSPGTNSHASCPRGRVHRLEPRGRRIDP